MLPENKKWYCLSLRLMGDNLPIEEIEAKLGLSPTRVARKGDHIDDNPRYAKHETNGWSWFGDKIFDCNTPFEEQISMLLDMIEPRIHELHNILSFPDVEGELYLGFSSGNGQGCAHLSADLVKRIAAYGLHISLDLYPPTLGKYLKLADLEWMRAVEDENRSLRRLVAKGERSRQIPKGADNPRRRGKGGSTLRIVPTDG